MAHPCFLDQIEKLVAATAREQSRHPGGPVGPNEKLLAHLLDIAFDKIPRNPASSQYRQGGTLGRANTHWFRAKTGNGRFRLFFRFHSQSQVIVYAWVDDEQSLRTYGSSSDAYATFARMLESGRPPNDWDDLVAEASRPANVERLDSLDN